MKKKLAFLMAVVAILGAFLTACTTDVTVKLEHNTLDILINDTATLKVEISTEDKATWSSSDSSIVAVTQSGMIQGKKPGTATITVAVGTVKDTCVVTVKPRADFTETEYTLLSGEEAPEELKTVELEPVFTPELTTQTVTWTTSNSSVATVDGGVVTAVAAGTATITVTASNGATGSVTVIVEALNPAPAVVTFVVTIEEELPEYVHLFLRGDNFGWDGGEHKMTRDSADKKKWTYTATWDFVNDTNLKRASGWKVVLGTVDNEGVVTCEGWVYQMNDPDYQGLDNIATGFLNGGATTINYHCPGWTALPADPNVEPIDCEFTIIINLKAATDKDLYLRGDITGPEWALNEDFKFTKVTDLQYKLEFTHNGKPGSSFGFKITGGDWANGELYINNGQNIMLTVHESGEVSATYDDVVWKGEEAPFECVINISIILKEETSSPIYLVGTLTDWGKNDDYKLTKDSTNAKKYTITLTITDPTQEVKFKFNNGNWGTGNELAIQGGSDIVVELVSGTINLDYTDVEWNV